MTQKIKFSNNSGYKDLLKPVPAYTMVPEWYKKTESYIGGEKKPTESGDTLATIKRCMPVFDAISAGYLILLPADVWVSIKELVPHDSETMKPIESEPTKKAQQFQWSNLGLANLPYLT